MRSAPPPRRSSGVIRFTVLLAATSVVLSAAACSKQGAGAASPAASGSTAASIQGDITFNDANLAKLDQSIKDALAGKDLSQLDEAMVVNVAVDYWNAGRVGFTKGTGELSVKGTFQAPANGRLDQQLSMLSALHSQNLTGLEVSAIDATAVKAPIDSYTSAGVPVLAIDSPLPPEDGAALYLGTPNYQAGQQAGEAMKAALGGKGQVVVLVGSLTASNAVQRIQGFEEALKGSDVKVIQKISDGMDQSKALSNAENAFQTNATLATLRGISHRGVLTPAADRAHADRIVRDLKVRLHSPEQPIGDLSGGNQQKVVFGRWLAARPRVLLLDEPTRGVDVGAKADIYRLIDDAAKEGLAVLAASSELEELLWICHRIVVMAHGRIVADIPRDRFSKERIMTAAAGTPAGTEAST
ncbi:substrate-binding domain-containing protein [Kitasatospora kifunensis]|uniref:ABC-type sugar transport system substrate-binding protein n=1 Tax=Kitasatospora kifunensis TaxID=58351 RepID=A0A7W7RB64_KITKI|nr:substrate-binding domain-containing protein [Kitasatospora kifunensis]MBB4928714.1 ABC-type sugar transport system substrate-binding protein [Kitasatospora kifunensis]